MRAQSREKISEKHGRTVQDCLSRMIIKPSMRAFECMLLQMHPASTLQRISLASLMELSYLTGDSDGTICREYVVVLQPIMFSGEVE